MASVSHYQSGLNSRGDPSKTASVRIEDQSEAIGIMLNHIQTQKVEKHFKSFSDKLFKIYSLLKVNVVSMTLISAELSPSPELSLPTLISNLGTHLDTVISHIKQFLEENDNEIKHYNNIIKHKLKPQIE